MNELRTKIFWSLHDHCTAQCSYCPQHFWGGGSPRDISAYVAKVTDIINHYKSLNRDIDWFFTGGEPLDYFDFPQILKLCKEHNGNIDLTSNGGKIWLDWWAIEPNVDSLHLSYHYWQNPNLVNFIIETFHKKGKHIEVLVPIRPDRFEDDMQRIYEIENKFGIKVTRQLLYRNADVRGGLLSYSEDQLRIINGQDAVDQKAFEETHSWDDILQKRQEEDPKYTGKLCNAGIEVMYITHAGWAKGSECNDNPLGNIWNDNFQWPTQGHKCGMVVCFSKNDQKITKFI